MLYNLLDTKIPSLKWRLCGGGGGGGGAIHLQHRPVNRVQTKAKDR